MFLKDELTSKILSSSKNTQIFEYKEEPEEAFTVVVGKPTYFWNELY